MTRKSSTAGLEPHSAAFLEAVLAAPALDWSEAEIANSRALIKQTGLDCFRSKVERPILTHELCIDGPAGKIPLQVKTADTEHSGAAVAMYIHGGGWVSGDLESSEPVVDRLAAMSRATVINVGYSVSPEVRFPTALEECAEALGWAVKAYGKPVAVIGDSAGANLAAALCLKMRDSAGAISRQVLLCPVLDPANERYESRRRFGGGDYLLTNGEMRQMVSHYVTGEDDLQDPLFAPMLAPSLDGLPPALVITAEFDMLVDEGRVYAERLSSFGVPVDYHMFNGTLHGFPVFGDALPLSYDALGMVASYLG